MEILSIPALQTPVSALFAGTWSLKIREPQCCPWSCLKEAFYLFDFEILLLTKGLLKIGALSFKYCADLLLGVVKGLT